MRITKRQSLIIYGLFFCLSILGVLKIVAGIFGFLAMLGLFFSMVYYIEQFVKKIDKANPKSLSCIFLSAYCVISLTACYYLFGLSRIVLIGLIIFNSLFIIIAADGADDGVKFSFINEIKENLDQIINSSSLLFIVTFISYLVCNFFANPIKNGSPTPWINISRAAFIIFFIITFLFLKNFFAGHKNAMVTIFYFFLVLAVIAIKYALPFGYDTLLHQAALKYIASHSRIYPLTPFYIGQYAVETAINFFTGWSFIFIERWFLPISSIVLILLISKYFLEKIKFQGMIVIVPLVVLIMLPAQFTYTSPFAFSLLWGIAAITFIYIFILNHQSLDYIGAILSALASIFIHPFVGLNILAAVIGAWFYAKAEKKIKKSAILFVTFLIESSIVLLSFGLYNWIQGSVLVLADPLFYAHKFLSLFNDPIWYSRTAYSFWLSLIYLYEKLHFIAIGAFVLCSAMICRKRMKADVFILIASLGAFISAWFFISSLEVSGYSYGDQVNYSFRLLQASKWLLWPIILLAFATFFQFITGRKTILKFGAAVFFSIMLTISWYLTYPRNDDISRINVNNIREADYKAIDFIYNKEGGKEGYLVFANQLFGAGAIQKYGFEPYYNSKWGSIFYYSIPMGGELNKRYEKIMSSEKFDPNIIYDVLLETNLRKAYLTVADYWSLAFAAKYSIEKEAAGYWNIDDHKIDIYLFELR